MLLGGLFLVIGLQAKLDVPDAREHGSVVVAKRWLALLLVIGVVVVGVAARSAVERGMLLSS